MSVRSVPDSFVAPTDFAADDHLGATQDPLFHDSIVAFLSEQS